MDFNSLKFLRVAKDGVMLNIKVKAGSRNSEFADILVEGEKSYLKLNIRAEPLEGKANKEILSFLGKSLGIKKSNIEIKQGDSSSYKQILLRVQDLERLRLKLLENLKV